MTGTSLDDWFTQRLSGIDAPVVENSFIADMLLKCRPDSIPWLINVAGTVGAGKSTMVERLKNDPLLKAYAPSVIQFDTIMENYPEYTQSYVTQGDILAFAKWELVARATGYDVLRKIMKQKGCIIFEYGGSDPTHCDFLKLVRDDAGYKVAMVYMTSDTTECEIRVANRARTTGRHTPPHYVKERHEKITQKLDDYKSAVSTFITVANDGLNPPDTSWTKDFLIKG